MSRQNTILLLVIAIALTVGMFLLFGKGEKRVNWWEHYRLNSADPYGTEVLHELLKGYFPGKKLTVVKNKLTEQLDKAKSPSNYFTIGADLWFDSAKTSDLLKFVGRGNRAFISLENLSDAMLFDSLAQGQCGLAMPDSTTSDSLTEAEFGEEQADADSFQTDAEVLDTTAEFVENTDTLTTAEQLVKMDSVLKNGGLDALASGSNFLRDSTITLNFTHKSLHDSAGYRLRYLIKNQSEDHRWVYAPPAIFCDSQQVFAKMGGFGDTLVNFVRARYGKGEFYLHTTPLVFTNIQMKEPRGQEYVAKALSHLAPGDIYWDLTFSDLNLPGYNRNAGESPLRYILSQPPLTWAWYILLAMAVLFVAFRAKREQRIIHVTEQNTNTSLEFIGTIGRLYFQQNNHRQLALQKMRLFLHHVRERYRLPVKDLDEPFVLLLSQKSEVPADAIRNILQSYWAIEHSGDISEQTLTEFHRAMEGFYKNGK